MAPATPIPQQVLDLPMQPNDADAATIRDYLVNLLAAVVREGEGFSGKRPFGNSGWECDLHIPLIQAGLIAGRIDADGYLEDCNCSHGDKVIAAAIETLKEPAR